MIYVTDIHEVMLRSLIETLWKRWTFFSDAAEIVSEFQERLYVDELSMRVHDFTIGGSVKY